MTSRYAIAHTTERCHCGRPAERVVATKPLCGHHFINLTERCRVNARARILTPPDMTPDGFLRWAVLLDHGINIGLITEPEAVTAWKTTRNLET